MSGSKVVSDLVLFDDPAVGQESGMTGHESIAIAQVTSSFIYHGRSIVRLAFLLVPCRACTIHEVQGMTFD